jgi:5-methylcytosine-specific restriction enzyme A
VRISDLPAPVVSAKADWLAGTAWLGFTPTSGDLSASNMCQGTIQRQFAGGYVIEYITELFSKPNPGFESDPGYLHERERHKELAGRFIAVHKLRTTGRPLLAILGDEEFKRLQDMWAQDGNRFRWSVAFPIVESYQIVGLPKAKEVLGDDSYRRLFQRSSATLRTMTLDERKLIGSLELQPVLARNAWIGIEDEIHVAEKSDVNATVQRLIDLDLEGAMEGESELRKVKVRRRAAWLAWKFILQRRHQNSLVCDECAFDPTKVFDPAQVNPRSLLDVHHRNALDEGIRYTTLSDFSLLCPTCHRIEHQRIKIGSKIANSGGARV